MDVVDVVNEDESRRRLPPNRANGEGSHVGLVFTAPCPGPPSVIATTGAPGMISFTIFESGAPLPTTSVSDRPTRSASNPRAMMRALRVLPDICSSMDTTLPRPRR